jgi:hypothetical protein
MMVGVWHAGTKLILNVLLGGNVTVARQAEKACRLTCFVTEETSPSSSAASTLASVGTGDVSAESDSTAVAEEGTGGSSAGAGAALAAESALAKSSSSTETEAAEGKVVPITYLFKTKHIQETDDFISIINSCIPKTSDKVAVGAGL